jgi:hypothetical protein
MMFIVELKIVVREACTYTRFAHRLVHLATCPEVLSKLDGGSFSVPERRRSTPTGRGG